jgi:quercetin dioxygenase-like cupin family protein
MRVLDFGPYTSRQITAYGSAFSMARLVRNEAIHLGCMYFGPGDQVGYHPAGTIQLFAVVAGEGWVQGEAPPRVPIRSGQAVLWQPGESHAAGSDAGMTVMVVESALLGDDPATMGPLLSR